MSAGETVLQAVREWLMATAQSHVLTDIQCMVSRHDSPRPAKP